MVRNIVAHDLERGLLVHRAQLLALGARPGGVVDAPGRGDRPRA